MVGELSFPSCCSTHSSLLDCQIGSSFGGYISRLYTNCIYGYGAVSVVRILLLSHSVVSHFVCVMYLRFLSMVGKSLVSPRVDNFKCCVMFHGLCPRFCILTLLSERLADRNFQFTIKFLRLEYLCSILWLILMKVVG